MKKTFGTKTVVLLIFMYSIIFVLIGFMMFRLVHRSQVYGITTRSELLIGIVAVAGLYVVYKISRTIIMNHHTAVIDTGTLTFSSMNPFRKALCFDLDSISKVHFIANKTNPEITITTASGDVNISIQNTYLALRDLQTALNELNIPTEVSGPSVKYFEMDRTKMMLYIAVYYLIFILALLVILFRIQMRTHHHVM